MRTSKIAMVITILLAALVLLVIAAPALASETYTLPRNEYAPPPPDPMDGTHMLGAKEQALRKLAARIGSAAATQASPIGLPADYGDEFTVSVSDMGMNSEYDQEFVVLIDGTSGIMCITKEAFDSFDGDYFHFANPNGIPGSSDPWERTEDLLTMDQLDYLLDCFDSTIAPTMSGVFGEPLPRGNEGKKVWILIHNIRDEAYYDVTQTTYVAGYFSSSEDALNNKNMMHIDTYDWANRTGPDSARPFLYEGVFAHEYEHLLHFDMDPNEESWVDEGLADLAAFLCGYMEDNSHVVYYLVYHPFTPLTFFGGGLESYGAAYLFQLYLWEKYGGTDFTKALFENPANGIEGVQNTLDDFAPGTDFDTVFDDWTVANYVDDPEQGAANLYGYDTLDIGTSDTWGYSIEYALQRYWYPSHRLKLPFALQASMYWGPPQPYTAHYYSFSNQKSILAYLKGDAQAGTEAYSGTQQWVSGQGTWAWRSFYQDFDAIPTDAVLKFWTFYDIEEDWDYGYVEVYDKDTGEWTTLQGVSADDGTTVLTTDTLPQVQDNPNVPDGREPMDYYDAGTWNAFTGSSGGWQHVQMDLGEFEGDDITLYFRTWQDGAFTLQMMYVDNISIEALGFSDDVESGPDGWTTPAGGDEGFWTVDTGLVDNNWQGTLIETLWDTTARYSRGVDSHARNFLFFDLINGPWMTPMTDQEGTTTKTASVSPASKLNWIYIVSNRANHILNADYFTSFTK